MSKEDFAPPSKSFVFGEMAVKAAIEELNMWSRMWFANKDQKEKLKVNKQEKLGEILIEGLSRLKGTGLKVLQNLAIDEEMIPPAMLRKVEQSFSQVTPMNSFLVKRILREELNDEFENLFEKFDFKALAAGSIGQVHRATLINGREVAIKIQYPHVKTDFQNEMNWLQKMSIYIEHPLLRNSIKSVTLQMLEEIDFCKEATNAKNFKVILGNSPFVLPGVVEEISGENLVGYEFLDGLPVIEVFQNEARVSERLCQNIYDFFFCSFFDHGILYADPHPGNFLQLVDGKMGVVDFGLVQSDLPDSIRNLFKGLLFPNRVSEKEVLQCYISLGAEIHDDQKEEFLNEVIRPFRKISQSMVKEDSFDFKNSNQLVKSFRQVILSQISNEKLNNFNSDLSLIHKSIQSLYLMLGKFKARIKTQTIFY
ncbi:MAG: hypothetical protein H6625_03375 [Bdellovibrionaceae bacterium]|nr:hypothetical protein [Pseudobdellovibrionaceae bacterium]